ncbi:MAG: dihydrodipicolinate reductase [Bacteroidota bacterium]
MRVVQYGLGPIGLACVQTLLDKALAGRLSLVGAIDIDPAKVGRDLADLLGRDTKTGVVVSNDAGAALAALKPDVVLHTTSSFLDRVETQLAGCLDAGAHVVSSTEELSFPYDRHPEVAARLNAKAKAAQRVVVGTGVNPGYAMDALALMATGVCTEVSHVAVDRVVDAGARRGPLQRKVGAGITAAAFAEKKATGTFGHIGLRESLLMVADGLGWTLDALEETLDPVLSDRAITTPHADVAAGQVAGIRHAIRGSIQGEEVLALTLQMYVGADGSHDTVRVTGTPPITLTVPGGIFGDTATIAALVNTAGLVASGGLQPGLRTMADLPVLRAFATR